MLRASPNALVCDLAETYGVFDYKSLPAKLLGMLAAGLGEESRSKMHLSGQKAGRMEILLAAAVDGLNRIAWMLAPVYSHEGERPRSILGTILGESEEENADTAFDSPQEFENAWEQITGVKHGGQ